MSVILNTLFSSSLVLILLCSSASTLSLAKAESLRDRIEALASANGFTVKGLHKIPRVPAGAQGVGSASQKLDALLADYDYLVFYHDESQIYHDEGQILEVRIAGLQDHTSSSFSYRVPSRGVGAARIAVAEVAGPGELRGHLPFFFNQGGKHVILSTYHLGALEFQSDRLRIGWTTVGNERVPAMLGRLPRLQIGAIVVHGVGVAFVDNEWTKSRHFIGTRSLEDFGVKFEERNGEVFLTTTLD